MQFYSGPLIHFLSGVDSEQSAAYYEINEVEAPVVRWVYECYTIDVY